MALIWEGISRRSGSWSRATRKFIKSRLLLSLQISGAATLISLRTRRAYRNRHCAGAFSRTKPDS